MMSLLKQNYNKVAMGRKKLIIDTTCKHTHFTWEERLLLQYHHNGTNRYKKITSPTLLGRLLSKHEQTIRRELKRGMVEHLDSNLCLIMRYNAEYAQTDANAKSSVKGPLDKLGNDWVLAFACKELIKDKNYSPYAVIEHFTAHGWPSSTRICEKTLYNYIKIGNIPDVTEKDLLYAGRRRKSKSIPRRHSRAMNAVRSIEKRPKEANERRTAGHWEMDTVYGGKECSSACLLTLTERKTRAEIIRKIPDRTNNSVKLEMDKLEEQMGTANFMRLFLSITPDNGSEFSDAVSLETSVNGSSKRTQLFFAHPYSSFERGTNENHNGIIRRFIPKGSDIGQRNDSEIRMTQDWMNAYPRKILGGATPIEVLNKELCSEFSIPNFLEIQS
jgi:transposase, IS30 family